MLSDDQWVRIEPLTAGRAGDPGRSGRDNRLFVEGVLWTNYGDTIRNSVDSEAAGFPDGQSNFLQCHRNARARMDTVLAKRRTHLAASHGCFNVKASGNMAIRLGRRKKLLQRCYAVKLIE